MFSSTRRILLLAAMAASAMLVGCSEERKFINGVEYSDYGLLNEKEKKNPDILYEMATDKIILSIIFSETVIIPIYIIGFNVYEPICKKAKTTIVGQVEHCEPGTEVVVK